MRIVSIRDIVSPIKSNVANAYIDFSQMTASVVAVVTDYLVYGKPVVGYGFNSNGRYAQHGLPRCEEHQALHNLPQRTAHGHGGFGGRARALIKLTHCNCEPQRSSRVRNFLRGWLQARLSCHWRAAACSA